MMVKTPSASATALVVRAFQSASMRRNASVLLGVASFGSSASSTAVVLCEGNMMDKLLKKSRDGSVDWNGTLDSIATQVGGQVQVAVDSGVPTQLSYGFISGYCSGLALKKAGRAAAVVFGLGFVVLQGLASSGYVTVDHAKVKKEVENMLDLNQDGKLDQKDGQIAAKKLMEVLQYNMPAGGGFAAGFVGGFRSG